VVNSSSCGRLRQSIESLKNSSTAEDGQQDSSFHP
jgi:hypothetical protein